jgi:hypothetical protein
MRKALAAILLMIVFTISLHAQEIDSAVASVHYNFSHINDTTQPESPNTEKMILFLGKNSSLYESYDRILFNRKMRDANPGGASTGSGTITNLGDLKSVNVSGGSVTFSGSPTSSFTMGPSMKIGTTGMLLKNTTDNKIQSFSMAYGKEFIIEETLPAIDWQITQETKNIQTLACQKATGHFRGRDYEAWFCPQLPYSSGPWKLGGLPGLIVEAYDTKKEVVFSFESFEDASGSHTAIELSKKAIKTTAKELKQFNDAMLKDRQAMMNGMTNSAAGGNIKVTGVTITRADGVVGGPAVKQKQNNNPIERDDK